MLMRTFACSLALAAAACLPRPKPATTGPAGAAAAPAGATESEWTAATDLATTLARAAGADRLAPALRVVEHGAVSRRHVSLAAAGCYHAGVAWVQTLDLEAEINFDPGTDGVSGPTGRIGAPGGAVDFCTEHAGGLTLTFRVTGAQTPDLLEYAVVYGSAKAKPAPGRVAAR